jgi:ABC-type lipoprotein release transport system permease subunit
LNVARYISTRIFNAKEGKNGASTPIIKVALFGVCLSILIIQLTFAIVSGFNTEIMKKVNSLQANYRVAPLLAESSAEAFIPLHTSRITDWEQNPAINNVVPFIEASAIIDSKGEISGSLLKGIPTEKAEYYLREFLLEKSEKITDKGVFISKRLAGKLDVQLNEDVQVFFINENRDIKNRKLQVQGIFETGIENIDDKLAFTSLSTLQKVVKPGMQLTAVEKEKTIEFKAYGNVISSELSLNINDSLIHFPSRRFTLNIPKNLFSNSPESLIILQSTFHTFEDTVTVNYQDNNFTFTQGKSTHLQYVSGYDVFTKQQVDEEVKDFLFNNTAHDEHILSAAQLAPEITSWLEMLNVNVITVIIILLVVAVVNMLSALLVIVLEKTASIGILKTIGAPNNLIQKVFANNTLRLLITGIVAGNVLALVLGFLQQKFQFITLNESQYILDHVPILFQTRVILLSNILILAICLVVLWFPTYIIAKINPAKTTQYSS